MGMNSNELLEYLIDYIHDNLLNPQTDEEKIFNAGQFEGMLYMLEIVGCNRIASKLEKRYGDLIRAEE